MHAIQLANCVDPGDRQPLHSVAQMFFFGTGAAPLPRNVWQARGGYYNDVFVDITDVVDEKLAAPSALPPAVPMSKALSVSMPRPTTTCR